MLPPQGDIRYTDTEARDTIAAEDAYVKNIGDTINGGIVLNGEITIYQQRDWHAIILHGYDDESGVTFEINIDDAGNVWFRTDAGHKMIFQRLINAEGGINFNELPLLNVTSYADDTLSGTPLLFVFMKGTTPYYVRGYPTKA